MIVMGWFEGMINFVIDVDNEIIGIVILNVFISILYIENGENKVLEG